MRSLALQEIGDVCGGTLVCSVGFPSGVKCEGDFSDWKEAVTSSWNFVASIPGTTPWTITKILERGSFRRGGDPPPPLQDSMRIAPCMPRKEFYFAGFVVAMFVYMLATAISRHLGLSHLDMVVEIALCASLTIIFPESGHGLGWGRRALLVLSSVTVGLGAIWTFGFWIWTSHSSNFNWEWRVIFPVLGVLLVTPWLEEKLLRHLLLHSLDNWLGPMLASVSVSILFAVAHKGIVLMAFIVSAVLCWMRYKFKAKTSHCVIVHGLLNGYVMLLYLF